MNYCEDIDKHRQVHAVQYGRMLVLAEVTRRSLARIVHIQWLKRHKEESAIEAVVYVVAGSLEKRRVFNGVLYL